uniref:ATP synthase F0 subunit 8 n=1 Tax=Metopiellus crypticus TaxID=3140185 RepID=A0AAT9QG87_9COLE|nr:ATP synthase F0 subunit 8 [Metopiellus sp.]UUK33560.1 ATP synthase F0 subunit 8 [Metopiellus sp.]UUK33573.1 ATP synthase F0 subunit 8 [Metopiellus sp.]
MFQMMPMNWLFLFIYFLLIYMMFYINMYFNFLFNPNILNKKFLLSKKWKW